MTPMAIDRSTPEAHRNSIQALIDGSTPEQVKEYETRCVITPEHLARVLANVAQVRGDLTDAALAVLDKSFASVEAFNALPLADRFLAMDVANDIAQFIEQESFIKQLEAAMLTDGSREPSSAGDPNVQEGLEDEDDSDPFGDLDD